MFTTATKNRIMNSIFRGVTGVLPTSISIGLSSTAPTEDGANITEPSASAGYARASGVLFDAAGGGSVSNQTTISFPVCTADAGIVTHYVLYDQNNLPFWYAPLEHSRRMEIDTILAFKVGDLKITLQDVV